MRTRGLRRDAGNPGQFTGAQRPSVQDIGAARIGHQSGDFGKLWRFLATLMLPIPRIFTSTFRSRSNRSQHRQFERGRIESAEPSLQGRVGPRTNGDNHETFGSRAVYRDVQPAISHRNIRRGHGGYQLIAMGHFTISIGAKPGSDRHEALCNEPENSE
jgi:hypothetical protein